VDRFPKTLFGFYFRRAVRGFGLTLVLWAIFSVLIKLVYDVMWPLFQKWFISLFEQTVPSGMTFIEFATPTILFMLAVWLFFDGIELWRSVLANRWIPKIRKNAGVILNDYVHSQSMSFWSARMAGKVDSQIGYIVNGLWVIFNTPVQIFGSVTVIVITSGLVLSINANIAAVLIAVFIFRFAFGMILLRPMNRSAKFAADSQSALHGKQVDSIFNYSIVKLFAGRNSERAHLGAPRDQLVKARIDAAFFQRLFWGVPLIVSDIAFTLMMFLCAVFYASGQMLVSEIVFTVAASLAIMGSIANIVNNIPEFVDILGSALKSYEELIKAVEITDDPDAKDLVVKKGAIEVRGVAFGYKKRKILNDFSLKIRAGEKVGLVGQSGAGKTTLVNLLMRLYDPLRGDIFIDGQNIKKIAQDSLRKNIAFIPQEPSMFNRTLKDNIGYGDVDAGLGKIRGAARRAEIDKFVMGLEDKYDSMVGDRGIKLSSGQKQRVAIARAFLKNAPILILDEATSALDSETEHLIQKSFFELSKGKTTLAIAHRLSTLSRMDRIVVMADGRIRESGTHRELIEKKNGLYAKMWKMQSGGFIAN
jgi:ATP-binding cassette subfamily B protein